MFVDRLPTDDGRIKPDLVADGRFLTSTLPNNQYGGMGGTSMATPVVAGGLALILEHWNNSLPQLTPAPASMIKALLVTSAVDIVNTNVNPAIQPGPDYQTGWGLFNAENAVDIITAGVDHFMTVNIAVGTNANQQQDFGFFVPVETNEVRISAAWTEPGTNPNVAAALINDVDIRLIDPNNTTHNPWVLNPVAQGDAAIRGDNNIDNVEQIIVNNPVSGNWILRVITGNNFVNNQDVSIVSSISLNALDTDGDLLSDLDENRFGTNPNDPDPDQDTLSDFDEVCFDGDCTSYRPYPEGRDTNANLADTDYDGLSDNLEIDTGRNPIVNEPVLITIISSYLLSS